MVDGATKVCDWDKTEENRDLVDRFIDDVLIAGQMQKLSDFVAADYVEHNPDMADGVAALSAALTSKQTDGGLRMVYEKRHRILAEGNFVLSVCEGQRLHKHTSFYDLFRVENAKIVEHWDTTETVPPLSEWKNDNGKF